MPGFTPRVAQQRMTDLIAEAIRSKKNALIEAGTGTGKTYAYLLPALTADQKVIISTGTKNLQDQLFFHDLPFINESFGRSTALLKGRANYLCLDRLHKQIEQSNRHQDDPKLETLVAIYQWSEHTDNGDLTEALDEEDLTEVQRLVTSTADNCLGQDCPSFQRCFLYKARQRALQADVVVVNHHLFFADLALKEDDLGELLPSAELIILDEVHQIEEIARVFYGQSLSSGQVFELTTDIVREQRLVGLDDPELLKCTEALERAMSELVERVCDGPQQSIATVRDLEVIERVDMAISDVITRLRFASERSVGLARCYSRACRLSDMFTLLTEPAPEDESAHYFARRNRGFTIHLVPLDVSEFLEPLLADDSKTWLLISATLATTAKHMGLQTEEETPEQLERKTFRHIRQTLGFSGGLSGRFASPFRFSEQVAGFIPDVPAPGDEQHTGALVRAVLPLVRSHAGRSLLLFTSHKALAKAAELMRLEYDLAVFVQGALAKPRLIARFRQTEGAVLLATHSFWEGVDLGGSQLRLLVIDKLPFTSPDDPVFQAKLSSIERAGGNSFSDLSLPKAAITLKQGFGRLIRNEEDAGLFVLGDPRLKTRSYGKTLQRCLPEFPWLEDQVAALNYLENLRGHTGN